MSVQNKNREQCLLSVQKQESKNNAGRLYKQKQEQGTMPAACSKTRNT